MTPRSRSAANGATLALAACPSQNFPFMLTSAIQQSPSDPSRRSFFLNDLLLCQLLRWKWEDRMSQGLFRYDVTAYETKVIPGKNGFIAQLNEGRHLRKRPTEFRVDRVLQPFDPDKFNFTKIGQEEVLFRLEAGNSSQSCFSESARARPPVDGINSANVVAINVLECLPQRIDGESLSLALRMAAEAGSPLLQRGLQQLGCLCHHQPPTFPGLLLDDAISGTRRIRTKGTRECGVEVSD